MSGFVFVSYSRSDQAYVDRLVEQLRDVGADVWIDHKINYGTQWAKVIQERVRRCAVMVVVMTPRSEESVWVQREINEAEKHGKTIMPILVEGDIWMRFNDSQVEVVRSGEQPTNRYVAAVFAASQRAGTETSPRRRPSKQSTRAAGPSVPTKVVDARGRGDFDEFAAAIEAAKPGTRLLVRPGYYTGGVTIDKPLDIVGDGLRDDIVIEVPDNIVIVWKARAGSLEHLTIRQLGGPWDALSVEAGAVDIGDCDISAPGRAGVIVDSSRANVRSSRIHECQVGVVVWENGRGTFEDNDITDNRYSGVEVRTGGDPTIRHNRITNNDNPGVYVNENGRGTFEDNDITDNAKAEQGPGVWMESGSPVFRRNRLAENGATGIVVLADGGTYEKNEGGHVVRI